MTETKKSPEEKSEKDSRLGHRDRLRARFNRGGINALNNYEILELLLFYAIPRQDVKERAKKIWEKFGSISAVINADPDSMREIYGINENSQTLLNLVKAICVKYLEEQMKSSCNDADEIMDSSEKLKRYLLLKFGANSKETMTVLFLNARGVPTGFKEFPGTVNRAAVYPREIVEEALKHKATRVALAHNHPAGSCSPSPEDCNTTRVMRDILSPLGIELMDHFIVTARKVVSMRELGKF